MVVICFEQWHKKLPDSGNIRTDSGDYATVFHRLIPAYPAIKYRKLHVCFFIRRFSKE